MKPSPDAPSSAAVDYSATLSQSVKRQILAAVLLCLLLAALDQTIVATALPRIVREMQGLPLLPWVSSAYLLASTTMVPIYGSLSDVYGRRVVLLVGIALFLGASALCGIAPDMLTLVLFRGLQGAGAAALTSTAFSIPADLFAPAERPRYQGLFGSVFGLASVLGPPLGGLLTDGPGWRWVFYLNLPLGLVAAVFVTRRMPALVGSARRRLDLLGSFLLVGATLPFLVALSLERARFPWGSPTVLGLFGASAVSFLLFLAQERRAPSPLIPFELFRLRTYALVAAVSVLNGAVFFSVVLYLTSFVVNVCNVSATQAGTALIPLTLSMVAMSFASSLVVQRTGRYKPVLVAGFVLISAGIFGLTTLGPDTTLQGVRLRVALLGLGLGPVLPLLTLAVQNAVPFEVVGIATASRQFFQQMGSAIGGTLFGVLLTTSLTQDLDATVRPSLGALPPAVAATLDPRRLRNGVGSSSEGGPLRPLEQRMLLQVRAHFEQESARGALPAPELAAQQRAAEATVARIAPAVRSAFAQSVVRVYRAAFPLALLALALLLALPNLELRRTQRATAPPPAD